MLYVIVCDIEPDDIRAAVAKLFGGYVRRVQKSVSEFTLQRVRGHVNSERKALNEHRKSLQSNLIYKFIQSLPKPKRVKWNRRLGGAGKRFKKIIGNVSRFPLVLRVYI